MKRLFLASVIITLFLCGRSAVAGPIISVDMNPLVGGIQSSRAVNVGDVFTVDVLVGDDGLTPSPTVFDTVLLELSYNDAGNVLGAGTAGPIGGQLASNSPFTIDLFGAPPPVMSATGSALSTGPSFPAAGFASGSGGIGLLDPLGFVIPPGSTSSIFSLDFIAISPGISTIFAGGAPPGSPVLSLAGSPIPAILTSGTVIVERRATAVPEPSTFALLATGCVLLIAWRHKGGRANGQNHAVQ